MAFLLLFFCLAHLLKSDHVFISIAPSTTLCFAQQWKFFDVINWKQPPLEKLIRHVQNKMLYDTPMEHKGKWVTIPPTVISRWFFSALRHQLRDALSLQTWCEITSSQSNLEEEQAKEQETWMMCVTANGPQPGLWCNDKIFLKKWCDEFSECEVHSRPIISTVNCWHWNSPVRSSVPCGDCHNQTQGQSKETKRFFLFNHPLWHKLHTAACPW